jgi:hypothetical protein
MVVAIGQRHYGTAQGLSSTSVMPVGFQHKNSDEEGLDKDEPITYTIPKKFCIFLYAF